MNEKISGVCDRCGEQTNRITTMSMFNTDIICMPCKETEKTHDDYEKASSAEMDACQKGEKNFKGIGLPQDLKIKYAKLRLDNK
jgi:hypothetical protein